MAQKMTKDEFVTRAKKIHCGKYDYSMVNYINGKTPVEIICPDHGFFLQSPEKHLKGQKCKKCSQIENSIRFRMTQEEFVQRAKERFGEKYNYSQVKYINNATPVTIICPSHGAFNQLPSVHLRALYGCPKCKNEENGLKQRKTIKDFIIQARKIHGDNYTYQNAIYTTNDTPILITCPIHGDFYQTPSTHLSGSGCPKCIGRNRTTAEFIEKASIIHKDKYDYSLVEYHRSSEKVKIICPNHGVFEQVACEHLSGKGCPKCHGRNRTTEEFIKLAHQVHGDTYDYSKVVYKRANEHIIIVCKKHGDFKQTPSDHLQGKGCRLCGQERSLERCRMKTEEFIERASILHNYKYDYSKVQYVNGRTLVDILCLKHNTYFKQQPELHLRGCGCPDCAQETRNSKISHDIKWFIREAIAQHGFKFDYSKVTYKNFKTEIEISCPKHGTFWQLPLIHINSKFGCPKCANEYTSSLHRMTQEDFLKKAKCIYGNKLIFDKVQYINSITPVEVFCKKHGSFFKNPNAILQGHGCPRCNGSLITNEDFITRAKEIHGDKYDYSLTRYHNMHSMIKYECPEHGIIIQMAQSHLKSGCRFCAGNVAITKSNFIDRSQKKFGNKFDFSHVQYYDYTHTPIEIGCPIHGWFNIKPSDFLQSKMGCPKCGRLNGYLPRMVKREEFINRCTELFDGKYDYSRVPNDMVLNDTLEIICPEHGSFYLTGTVHLHNKVGCAKCAGHNKTK